MTKIKTWEDECLPAMRIQNKEGDVALLVLWDLLDDVHEMCCGHGLSRVSTIGNLRTPLGISWLLRGLGKLPHITTIVVWGNDLTRTGEAILSLWKEGVADHRVPRLSWKLDQLIDCDSINRFRREIEFVDGRSVPMTDLARFLSDLPKRDVIRLGVAFPPVELPDRVIFPSRGGFVQLSVQNLADAWIRIQDLLTRCGSERRTRKGETLNHVIDVKVVMPVPIEEVIGLPFDFTPEDFEVYYQDFISSEPPPQGIDYRYGQRMQNWRNHNQLEEVIQRLKKSQDTKRATVVLLDPTDLKELKDAPCVSLGTFCVQSGVLSSSWVIRSNDMYSGWPFNVLSLIRVHRMVAEEVGLSLLGYISVLSQNSQIYERHIPAVQENLARWGSVPEDFGPEWKFHPDPAGNFIFKISDGQVRMTITNAEGDQVVLEMEYTDPSALIGWVVDTMPWLARQHIRYLGQEQQKLIQALKEGTPYIQG